MNKQLNEGLGYKDMEGMIKPMIHIDEFASKMGGDVDVCVVSFYVTDTVCANDLVNWFESGYNFVLDADRSPGEIRPGRFLVYVEMRRRTTTPEWIEEMISDLSTLTEWDAEDWKCHYEGEEFPFSVEAIGQRLPLSPKRYRELKQSDLNEMRVRAGLDTKRIFENDRAMRDLQNAAGI